MILALVVATEYAIKALERPDSAGPAEIVTLVVVTLLAAAVVTERGARAALAGIALLQLVYVWGQFPHAGNHRYLGAVVAFYLAVLDPRRQPGRAAPAASWSPMAEATPWSRLGSRGLPVPACGACDLC